MMKKKITRRQLTTVFLSGALLLGTLVSPAALSAEYLLDDGESVYTEENVLSGLSAADAVSEEIAETKSDATPLLPDAAPETEASVSEEDSSPEELLISGQPDAAQVTYSIVPASSVHVVRKVLIGQPLNASADFEASWSIDEEPYYMSAPVQVTKISLGDLNPAGCAAVQEIKDSSTGKVTGYTINGIKEGTGSLYVEYINPEGKTQKERLFEFQVVKDDYRISADMNDRNNAMFPGAEKGAYAEIAHTTAGGQPGSNDNVTYEWTIAEGFDPLVTIKPDPADDGSNRRVLIKAAENISSGMEYVMLRVAAYDLDSSGKRVEVAATSLDVIITKTYTVISPESIDPDTGYEAIPFKPVFYYCWQDEKGNHKEIIENAEFTWDYLPDEVSILDADGNEVSSMYADEDEELAMSYSYGTTFTIRRKSEKGAEFWLDAEGSYEPDGDYLSHMQTYTLNEIPTDKVAVTGVTLNKQNIAMSIDTTDTLTASVSPANATNKNVTWTSSDPAVVSVDSTGKITALKDGFAKITVTTADGGKTAVCNVTVKTSAVTMYRVYNPYTGEHLYTTNAKERDECVKRGWKDEGVAWNSPTSGDIAVYRLYNPKKGFEQHHYTADQNEINILVKDGWKKEGIAWFSKKGKVIPIYRAFYPAAKNPAACHHLTKDAYEYKVITTQQGWKPEGIAFYAIS